MADEKRTTDRSPRGADTRDTEARTMREYVPPNLLPDPNPQPGWRFKWVRTSMIGKADNMNVSTKFRSGYIPVKAEEVPELNIMSDHDSRFAKEGNIEVGGLLLCKIPEETAESRNRYYEERARAQMESVDRNFMRENDPRMPLLRPDRKSRTAFGRGG